MTEICRHPELPPNLTRLPRSGIRAVMDAAWAYPGEVNHLVAGEPDFDTPEHIVRAFCNAAEFGHTRYTPNAGIPELRAAIVDKLARRNGIAVEPDGVLVTVGATEALHLALNALVPPGSEVLIPCPGWPNYVTFAALAGADAVRYRLQPSSGYRLDVAELDAVATDRTRAIVINSPSNPLGVVHDRDELVAVAEWARQRGIWVIADECYDEIYYDEPPLSIAAIAGGDGILSVHSFSKTYAMTGFRLGYVSGPPDAIGLLIKLQESAVACVNAPTQFAGVTALTADQSCVATMVEAYRTRRDAAVSTAAAAGLNYVEPAGAFYLWLTHPNFHTDTAVELLERSGVAVAPGVTFDPRAETSVRISLASSAERILDGIEALAVYAASR